MASHEKVIGTQQAARILGVSVRTVQLWVEKGVLQAWKTAGGHRRITQASVDALLRIQETGVNPESARPLHILVVEDDPTMQAYYSALVEILHPGAVLQVANDGFEGLIQLGRSLPQLLLVDVDMPGMDGIEMLKSIQRLKLPATLIKAVVTSLSEDELQQRGGVPAGIPVFGKPVGADALNGLITQAQQS